jgi:hypothetical protein
MSVAAEASAKPKLGDGTGAILIALIYTLAGPIVGLVLIVPIAAVTMAEAQDSAYPAALFLVTATFPISIPLSYYFAGVLALATGVVVAAIAYRRRRVPAWMAAAASVAVFVAFEIPRWLTGVVVPGTGVLRDTLQAGTLVWLAVCVGASLICWLITLPIQRRMR